MSEGSPGDGPRTERRRRGQVAPVTRFFPRVTLMFVTGLLIFGVVAGLYVLPALLETPPPGAVPGYTQERVRARLEGKIQWMLAGSFVTATLLALRVGRPR